ncbi:methylaspartate mutase, S subunit [Alkaliphilus metalliredigens QYMF]|uniref:Glutamate mutase sigma subunit n=1 Tax=Alkaliphilus metalliredigens (strain QYMF) TaxID=293826 RepID=A6TTM6_ALKMQ|nr:methylaspartate mutase subunit S [Alkaliphilus metalliredigens]ABR49544.1 methylaspartate mutase, S subunit [Alkaliphilus metalliredigens QYMF]
MMKTNIVLGVIGADCHAVGNKVLDYAFTQGGFEVINIGVLSAQEDFINAAIETNAAAILVSSLYGHGEMDCRGLREKCEEAGLKDILLYAGGNLVVGKQDFDSVKERFEKMGFDRVYAPGTSPDAGIADLKTDLAEAEEMAHYKQDFKKVS